MWNPFARPPKLKTYTVELPSAAATPEPWRWSIDDGTKFAGGYGPTDVLLTDYWTLRQRSAELFERNLYARGLIRRLVTNEINVGLHLEATPDEGILGFERDGLADWSESIENRFALWAANPWLCDHAEQLTFGQLQKAARMEALISGDVLVVLRQDARTRLPRVQLISGASVQTPPEYWFGRERGGNKVSDGVELDGAKRHVAYWIRQEDGSFKRLPCYGEKSGRRLAWLLYGAEKRLDQVRGKPLLSLILQSLKEIDRFRDSTQRKAVLLSMLAMWVSKTTDKPGTRPITGGAIRKGTQATVDTTGQERRFKVAEQIPGWIIQELQTGEEPHAFQTNGTVENFGEFEDAVLQSIAWTHECPPEILKLSFNNNYSASQAAINEFKIKLNVVRTDFGQDFCQPCFVEWLLAETLSGKIEAAGLLDSWRDNAKYDVFAAWTFSDWSGSIKPAVDMSKLVGGIVDAINAGLITRARAARELFGVRYSKVIQQLERENEQYARAMKPVAGLEASKKGPGPATAKPDEDPDKGDDEADEDVEANALRHVA